MSDLSLLLTWLKDISAIAAPLVAAGVAVWIALTTTRRQAKREFGTAKRLAYSQYISSLDDFLNLDITWNQPGVISDQLADLGSAARQMSLLAPSEIAKDAYLLFSACHGLADTYRMENRRRHDDQSTTEEFAQHQFAEYQEAKLTLVQRRDSIFERMRKDILSSFGEPAGDPVTFTRKPLAHPTQTGTIR